VFLELCYIRFVPKIKPCKKGHPFERHANGKGQTRCAECNRIASKNQYLKLTEKQRNIRIKNCKKWNIENVEYVKEYRRINSDKIKKSHIEHYLNNREKYIINNRLRRGLEIKATPKWSDPRLIKDIYIEAKYHGLVVDHIVPLKGKTVCGLHWEGNMQLLPKMENQVKGNRLHENLLTI